MDRPKIIVFQGLKYTLSGSYYRRNKWGSKGPSSLHRAIWEQANGPIPHGYEVHHKDGDTFNNELSNLECISAREHQREHMLERHARGEMGPPGPLARERAAEWHRSEAGAEWHSQNSKKIWAEKVWHDCKCQVCGVPFKSAFPTRAKFCHQNCRAAALRERRGMPARVKKRVEPKIVGKRSPD